MSRYRACDLARLGENARRQIDLARLAFRAQDALKAEKAGGANKFGAVAYTGPDGKRHGSGGEGERWETLKLKQRAGLITNLIHQPSFDLVINGHLICRYIADAEYYTAEGERIVEDFKSKPTRTATYRIKRKLMAALHGIEITEVTS